MTRLIASIAMLVSSFAVVVTVPIGIMASDEMWFKLAVFAALVAFVSAITAALTWLVEASD